MPTFCYQDSRAITEMLRDYANMAERLKEARRLYIDLAQTVAAVSEAQEEQDQAAKVIAEGRKRLQKVGNEAHAHSNRWMYEPTV